MSLENLENKKNKNKEEEREIEDLGDLLKSKILGNRGEYSEKLTITGRDDFERQNLDGTLTSFFAHMAQNPENLYLLSKKIQEKFPELEFNFERDENDQWIKYTVKEKMTTNE